ncbi:hypothetical protein [Algibacillus agarilyticus]|uniref:hypothetical protein n=1 Tax=Algibacillus agarilyticus TaxID=2234133 RepID=UPI000DCFDED4|nr:hypothetical protein [Algibacillus agarilyticus]
MKTISNLLKTITLASLTLFSLNTYALGGASEHSGQASKHSVLTVAHSGGAVIKTASAVVAVPLIVVGEVGDLAQSAGNKLLENANCNTPLEITDHTVIAGPAPQDALKIKQP